MTDRRETNESTEAESTPVRGMAAEMVQQAPLLVVLVLLWLFLWGSFTPVDVIVGFGVAVLVTRVFELPPVQLSGRFNPWWFLVFLADFARQVVAGSIEVAGLALRPRRVPASSVIEVGLLTRSDFAMTLISIAISLVPGSLILEVDRDGSTLFLHVLAADTDEKIDKVRTRVMKTELSILRALGSRDELDRAEQTVKEGK